MKLKIEYLPVEALKPYKNNARKHGEEDIDAICESIKEFGFDDPIGIWQDTIVEGHGRLMAAKKLGMTEVPVIRLDHLTDEQRKAYALAHNRTAELSKWDSVMTKLEIKDIEEIDMTLFGFILDEETEKEEKPEVEFTEVLGEEHNYVVLYFDNEVDWLQIESILDIQPKKSLSTRKDGRVGKNMKRISLGRVLNGAKALEMFREHYENLH